MAKIDTSKITGYSDMTPEEKLAALESFEYEELDAKAMQKLKDSVDKATKEAGDWKKKHNALLSEEELKKQENDAAIKAMQTELETLKREKTVTGYTARYVAMGYAEDLAGETAAALADGDMEKVFANQAKHNESVLKQYKSAAMKSNPTPPAGSGDTSGNYSVLAEEAMSRGDFATAAAYMRMQQSKP